MSQRSSGGRSGGAGGAVASPAAAVASPRGALASPRRARAAPPPPPASDTAIDLTLDSDDDAAPARGAPARGAPAAQPARRAAARESQDDCVIVAEVVPPEAAAKRAAKSAVLDLTKDDDPLLALLPNGAPTDGAVRFFSGATSHPPPRPRGQPPWGGAVARARRGSALCARTLVWKSRR